MNKKINIQNNRQNQINHELFEVKGKNRRDKEKNAFLMLANLLPLSPPIRDQLDKSGVIRVIIAYLQFNQLILNLNGLSQKQNINNQNTTKECFDDRQLKRQWAYKNNKFVEPLHQFALNFFQAMDGFIIVLNNKGYILYVSETVAIHLGLSQATLVGSPISNFLYPSDVTLLIDKMALFVDCSALKVTNPDMSIVLRFLCSAGRKPLPNSSKGLPGIKAIHFMGTLWPDNDGRFIGFGHPMLSYGQNELPLNSTMFMFRANLSLKLIFVDNSFMEIIGFSHKLLLENSLYKFVYPNDLNHVSEMHQTTLSQGYAESKLFRLFCATGENFWIKCNLYLSTFNRINLQYNREPQMLIGICYIISKKENNIINSIKYEENDNLFNYYTNKLYFDDCNNLQGSSKN